MAKGATGKPAPRRRFGMQDLWRTAIWGVAAAGAVLLAAFVSTTQAGSERLTLALALVHTNLGVATQPVRAQAARPAEDSEAQRLAETVRALAADRDRALARIASLERAIEATGSIPRGPDAAPPSAPAISSSVTSAPAAPPAVVFAPPQVTPVSPPPEAQPTPPAPAPFATPLPPPRPEQTSARPEFGIDLGSASTVEGLRVLWTTAKARHGTLLEGLRPVMTVRDHARPGGVELRLIAGPLANATAAARLCAAMVAAVCQPAVYEGQRLALR